MQRPEKYSTSAILKWLWKTSRGARGMAFLSALIGITEVGCGLGFIWISKNAIDIATGVREGSLLGSGLFMGTLMLCEILLSALNSWILSNLGVKTQNRLRSRLFARLMGGEWKGIEQHHSGDVLNRLVQDLNTVVSLVTDLLPSALVTAVQLVASFLLLFSMDRMLAVIVVLIMPVFALLSKLYVNKMRRMTKAVRESDSKIHAVMQESLQNKMVIKTLEQNDELLDKLGGLQETLQGQIVRRAKFSIFTRSLVTAGFATGYLTAFLWGVLRIQSGTITFGVMTAFLQLVGRIQRPITDLAKLIPTLVGAFTAGERLMELEEMPLEETGNRILLSNVAGVRIEKITFHYAEGDKNIFNNFSFDFPPRSSTAILGETGAGKTTLIRLMLALIKPSQGKVVLYNGQEEQEASPLTRGNFVYVPQGNTLFSGTIRENLLLGSSSATEENLWRVLHLACADFVKALPEGLDTRCGEQGGGLSEGQAQRIAIARSLLREGSILLLDEATSALDPETEKKLLQRITQGEDGKTLIFITHRPSVVDYCSQVLSIG